MCNCPNAFAKTNCASSFNDLGCPEDASDQIVTVSYHLQTQVCPSKIPDYLSALTDIALTRSSEALQTEVQLELSKGRFDRERLMAAYRDFNLSIHAPLQDEYIIGVFESRLLDMPSHQHDLRDSLRIIGTFRGSQKIVATAENCESSQMRLYFH